MGSSGHGCSSMRMSMLLPHAAAIRSAKTAGSMKRSPMMAIELDMDNSPAHGREPFPDRPCREPGIEINREHLCVARDQRRIRRLRRVQIRPHPILRTDRHIRIKANRDGSDHRRARCAGLAAATNTYIAFEGGPKD